MRFAHALLLCGLAAASAAVAPCNKYESSDECLATAGCGWCEEMEVHCLEGTEKGPAFTPMPCKGWVYGEAEVVRDYWARKASEALTDQSDELAEIENLKTQLRGHKEKLSAKAEKCLRKAAALSHSYDAAVASLDKVLDLASDSFHELRGHTTREEELLAAVQSADAAEAARVGYQAKLTSIQRRFASHVLKVSNAAIGKHRHLVRRVLDELIHLNREECKDEFHGAYQLDDRIKLLDMEADLRRHIETAAGHTREEYFAAKARDAQATGAAGEKEG